MSLIDEALKRARLDVARTQPQQRRGPSPWVAVQAGHATAARRSRRALLTGVLAGGLGVALLGGAAFWLAAGHGQPGARAAEAQERAATKSADAAPRAAAEKRAAPPGAEGGAVPAGVADSGPGPAAAETRSAARAARAAARAALEAQGTTAGHVAAGETGRRVAAPPAGPPVDHPAAAPAAGAAASAPPTTGGAGQRGAGEATAPAAAENGREYSRQVLLPGGGKLALSGIAFSEHQPVAVINGKVVGPGEVVSEFTVARIQADRVELHGHGISIVLLLN